VRLGRNGVDHNGIDPDTNRDDGPREPGQESVVVTATAAHPIPRHVEHSTGDEHRTNVFIGHHRRIGAGLCESEAVTLDWPPRRMEREVISIGSGDHETLGTELRHQRIEIHFVGQGANRHDRSVDPLKAVEKVTDHVGVA
jgi:hypothetical protein